MSSTGCTLCCSSQVRFGSVEVRHYELCLSDNPSVSGGAPIGIGWDVLLAKEISVDEFERVREFVRRTDAKLLMLPKAQRYAMLLSVGYTQKEIARSVKEVVTVKNQRRQTLVNDISKIRLKRFMEETKLSLKGALSIGKNKDVKMTVRDSQELIFVNAAA